MGNAIECWVTQHPHIQISVTHPVHSILKQEEHKNEKRVIKKYTLESLYNYHTEMYCFHIAA